MTRKDFELIAKAMRAARNDYADNSLTHSTARRGIDNAIAELSYALADTNPRFDRARFVAACKGE